jgi:hypothetical protein
VPTAVVLANLIYIAVDGTVPADPTVTVLLKVMLSVLTSKPAGAVTVNPAFKLSPETVNKPDVEGVP